MRNLILELNVCISLPIGATGHIPKYIDVANISVILIVSAFLSFQLLGRSSFLIVPVILAFLSFRHSNNLNKAYCTLELLKKFAARCLFSRTSPIH
jgi:hypothetical protein